VKSAAETRIIDLDLSARATEGLASFIRPRGTVRELVENVTVAQLRATPGMGAATIAEVEKAIAAVCGCAFVDSGKDAAPAPAVEAPAPTKARRTAKKSKSKA
jgi:hypothetical protein